MKLFFTAIFAVFCFSAFAQGIKGKITDDKQQPVPFATIYIESLQTGTTSNIDGEFEIKTPLGKFTILFRALGFKSIYKEVEITDNWLELKIQMQTENYQLKEVVISAKSEDPAYYIMRKAIALAPYHLREVSHYESMVYLKGTVYIDKMPKLLSKYAKVETGGQEYKIKTGDVYVEETILDITFNAPRFYKRKVRSMRSSVPGDNKNPANPVIAIEASFYEPEIMDLISPLSPQAFQHYKFKYEGFTQDGEYVIDKIRVTPRRKSQDLFEGFVFIVDGKWCLHSLDLTNTQFWGDLRVKEIYGRVEKKAWLPISYNFSVNAKYLGIRGRYRYASSVKYSNVILNEKLSAVIQNKPVKITETPIKKSTNVKSKKISQKLAEGNLSNTEMRKVSKAITEVSIDLRKDTLKDDQIKELTKREIDTLATKRDTNYWNEFRPVPLTNEEVKSFSEGPQSVIQRVRQDSIRMAKDSTKKEPSKLKKSLWVLGGKQFNSNNKKILINYKGLIQLKEFNFNTIDGFRYGLMSNITFKLDSGRRITFQPWIGYAFNRKALMWELESDFLYTPEGAEKGTIKVRVGNKSMDFNDKNGIHPFINTISSLFFRRNYLKLYDDKYIEISNSLNLKKNNNFTATFKYEHISELSNHSDYSFFFRKTREYTSNVPANPDYMPLNNGETYKNFVISASLTINPYRKPKSDGLNREYNHYPTISMIYTLGLPGILSSASDFQKIDVLIKKRYWLGRNRVFKYQASTGYWVYSKNAYFSVFSPVKTNELPVSLMSFDYTYQLLPYYSYNTNDWYLSGNVHYQTKLLILKRLPFISKKIWTENIYLNYLHTPYIKHYIEFGYALGQLWAIGEFGVFTSFENFRYRSVGLKASIAFE